MTVVTFTVGELYCGAEASLVQEVLRRFEVRPVPLADPATPGLIYLRGQILTAIDLRSVFGLEAAPEKERACVVVCDDTSTGAFLVDRIGEVIRVESDSLAEAPPHWDTPERQYLKGVEVRQGKLLRILDTARLLQTECAGEESAIPVT